MRRHVRIHGILFLVLLIQLTSLGQARVVDTATLIISVNSRPTVRALLNSIRLQAGISFAYSNYDIRDQDILELPRKPVSVGAILMQIAETFDVTFIFYGDFIAIKKTRRLTNKGQVLDEENIPLAGVLIHYPGSIVSYKTDQHGRFDLPTDFCDKPYEFFLDGYEKIMTETAGHRLIVRMKRSNRDLQEVMVMGYYSTPKWKNTASISLVDAQEASLNFNKNIIITLQGKVPGLIITDANGAPGSSSRIQIRGQQSIGILPGASNLPANNPLILVNKMIWAPSNQSLSKLSSIAGDAEISGSRRGVSGLNTINLDDVENIFVYKDADATAIFGSQGSNGVISIITKKGNSNGAVKYSFNATQGIAISAFRPVLMNTEQYVSMRREYLTNSRIPENETTAPELLRWPLDRYSDWSKLLLGSTANLQKYHVSATGGNSQFRFYGGAGFQQETTVLPDKYTNRNSSLHLNTTYSPGKRFSTQFSIYLSQTLNQQPVADPMPFLNLAPNAPSPIDSSGKLVFQENGLATPNILAQLKNRNNVNTHTLLGMLYNEYTLSPKWLFKMRLGISNIILRERNIFPLLGQPDQGNRGFTEHAHTNWQNISADPQLQYLDTFTHKKITFLFTAGTTLQLQRENWEIIKRSGYKSDLELGDPNFASETEQQNGNTNYRYEGFYAATNITLQNKLIVNITGRLDRSSRIGNDRKIGLFGAIGTGWIFSKAKWMKKYSPIISFGKLRASIGTTGNDNAGSFNPYNNNQQNGGTLPVNPAKIINPVLGWEQTLKKEIALDLQLLKQISLSLAWYHNITTNQLISIPIQGQDVASYLYAVNHPASVVNSGLEFNLEAYWRIGRKAKLSTEIALTLPRNILKSFKSLENSLYKNTLIPGHPLTEIRGLMVDHVDPETGRYTFKDISRDGQINALDQVPIGNFDPVFYGGCNSKLNLNQWEISVFIEGRQQMALNPMLYGFVRQPGSYQPDLLTNQSNAFLQRWVKPGDLADLTQFSVAAYKATLRQLITSDRMLADASYLRVKNISVGWTGLNKWLNNSDVNKIRLYIRFLNMLTITKYKGGDPTIQYPMEVPSLRSFMMGIEIGL